VHCKNFRVLLFDHLLPDEEVTTSAEDSAIISSHDHHRSMRSAPVDSEELVFDDTISLLLFCSADNLGQAGHETFGSTICLWILRGDFLCMLP
jgi:hypothetical protein